MDIGEIVNDRAKGEVEYMGHKVAFTYRPAMITPENYRQMVAGTDPDELGTFFAGVLSSWDITRNGTKVEITGDECKKLPVALLQAFGKFIAREVPAKDLGNS